MNAMLKERSLVPTLAWVVPVAIFLLAAPHVVGPFHTLTLMYGLVFGIAVLGFNLLLGYTGLLSFGHSAYFGAGAYTVAFMVKYFKIASMELFLAGSVLISVLISLLFGVVCVRYTRIFFGILTLALSQVLWSLAFKFFWVTGGTDGLRVPTPSLLGISPGTDKMEFLTYQYYYYVLAIFTACVIVMWVIVHSPFGKALQAIRDNETRAEFVGIRIRRYRLIAFVISGVFAVCVVVMWVIVRSPFGKALQAIRDNETRAEFIGIRIRRYRLIAFVVSGAFAGLAGALWAPLNGLATPAVLVWTFSGEIVFMAVLGGFNSFIGPIVGAVAFTYLKTYAVGFTVYWQLLLGTVLVVLVLPLPKGIMGAVELLAAKLRRPR